MVSVRKSPNMMSTTGRRPVMAAPTPMPVKPASEIGVSSTRSAPNSSTSPERTLNGVPASATSSPKIQTRESRRISSARASRTACANVSSRSGIDVLGDLINAGIRCVHGEFHSSLHFVAGFGSDAFEFSPVRVFMLGEPLGMKVDGIAIGSPVMLFRFRTVVLAINIPHMMAAVAVCISLQECRTFAGAGAPDQPLGNAIHGANILPINGGCFYPESCCASENRSGGGFAEVRVLVVEIVFANVDHGKFPELRQVHDFV